MGFQDNKIDTSDSLWALAFIFSRFTQYRRRNVIIIFHAVVVEVLDRDSSISYSALP